MSGDALAIVGLIRNAQGIRGEVVIEPLTDAPDAVFAPGRRLLAGNSDGEADDRAGQFTVEQARPFKAGLMVKFAEVADRTAAELLRGRYVLAPFSELDPPQEDEIYLHDLLGMTVRLDTGEVAGEVTAFYELPQGLTLDVATGKGSVLVPYRPEIVERTADDPRVLVVKSDLGLFE